MSSPPSDSEPTPSSSFAQLDERVRRWIWDQRWTELREVQERAIPIIQEGVHDVILAAATAAGKTEAAFLPIASAMAATSSEQGIGCLYVAPLKALINDQWERLSALFEHLQIPVHRWHGDVSREKKRRVLHGTEGGVLLITPESLEAMFILRGPKIPRLFAAVRFCVVDELHAFLGTERGRQLQSLLHRLELAVRRRIPRIGLSATLGDMGIAKEFLRPREAEQVRSIVASDDDAGELKIQLRGHRRVSPLLPEVHVDQPRPGDDDDAVGDVCEHLFSVLRGSNNLVFANSRSQVEVVADRLRRLSESARVPNEFLPHHGNLSKELREDAERLLKERDRPMTAICTSTLEMGIHIGSVSSVAQIGAPPAVAALRQRLGRSGRRGQPAVLRVYVTEDAIEERSPPQDAIRAQLVQCIAMVELVLERWSEPSESGALHYSTLIQQLLSLIAQHGGVAAAEAHRALCEVGPFRLVEPPAFVELLRALGARDLITQMGDGTLVLGLTGEKLVNHYDFYAAFSAPDEYRVVAPGRVLGRLAPDPGLEVGGFIIFAGRRWKVVTVDERERVIDVVPAAGGRPPSFAGGGGRVHRRVREVMRDVYLGATVPAYTNREAELLLAEGRHNFVRIGLTEHAIVSVGGGQGLFPWTGDREMETILAELRFRNIEAGRDGVAITVPGMDHSSLLAVLEDIVRGQPIDALELARRAQAKAREKHDSLLPEGLLNAEYAARNLDPLGARAALEKVTQTERRT